MPLDNCPPSFSMYVSPILLKQNVICLWKVRGVIPWSVFSQDVKSGISGFQSGTSNPYIAKVMDSHTTCPGFKTWWVRFLPSFWLTTTINSVCWCVWKVREGFPDWVWHSLGSCVFQCDVPHQWIAQRQVGPVSVYCDCVGCHVLCLRHGISVWQHIGQSTTATSRHRHYMTSDV